MKKFGNRSRAMRSVRQTETDYGGTGGGDFLKKVGLSSEWNGEKSDGRLQQCVAS